MTKLNSIIKELQDVRPEDLDELYNVIHSFRKERLSVNTPKSEILSFAGCFGAMSQEEYGSFSEELKHVREDSFSRDFVF